MADHGTNRRAFLVTTGATGLAATAGCLGFGGGGGGGGGDEDYVSAAEEMGFMDNWQERRIGGADNWPIEDRQDVPDRANDTTWTDSGAFQSAVENEVWTPPEGWQDTPAGDVDSIQIINHGAANMEFDPATLAAHEYFTEVTGINVNVVEIGVDQANQREQQVLSSQQESPHAFNVDGALVPEFVQQGYLATTDTLYSEDAWEPYIPALRNLVEWDIDESREGTHTYGYPNITEGSLGHMRPDLLQEQGIDPAQLENEWSWDLLEEIMQAFEGTDTFGFAYYAGTSTYLSYSYRELLYQQGGRMVQDDGSIRMDTDASVRVVEKMKEWRDNGWVPGDVISYGEGDLVDLFLSGQLAFATGFSDFVPSAMDQFEPGSQYRPVVPPAANAGPEPTQAALVDPNSTSVNTYSDTPHKLAALLYGDLKLSYLIQWWEFTYEGNMSYMDRVYDDAAQSEFTRFGDVLGEAIDNGVLELFPQMASVFQQMVSPIQRAIQGDTTPEDAMSQVQSFVDDNINN